jgi:hypothetical protein
VNGSHISDEPIGALQLRAKRAAKSETGIEQAFFQTTLKKRSTSAVGVVGTRFSLPSGPSLDLMLSGCLCIRRRADRGRKQLTEGN